MIVLLKHVSFFLLISLILFSCSKKGTEPEPPPKKPAIFKGQLVCHDNPAPDVEVLVLEYKPEYDTLGSDTTTSDSAFFHIDDLPDDTVNVIFNDVVFTGPHEDYFTAKVKLIFEKGSNEYEIGMQDTSYLDEIGRPNYALDHVLVWFDTSIVDSATAEEIIRSHGTYIREWLKFVEDIAVVHIPSNSSLYGLIKKLNSDFYIKSAFPDLYYYLDVFTKGYKLQTNKVENEIKC